MSEVMTPRRGWRDHPLAQLTLVRFREYWREPEAVFWVFVFPVLLMAGLGLAFRNQPASVLKVGAATPELAASLKSESGLEARTLTPEQGTRALREGRIVLYLDRRDDQILYRFDDTNPDARLARLLVDRGIQRAAGTIPKVQAEDDLVREPGSRYIDFLVPGLLGMNLMGSGIWGLGFAIVDARRKNLLKRLVASPMPRSYYLLSFLLSRLVLLLFEVIAIVGFARLLFRVPLNGSLGELALLCLLSSLSFSAIGLLTASRAKTMEAVSGLMNFIMLPMWIFSGVFFSTERFPAVAQPFIHALPLTAVNDLLRGNMQLGMSIQDMLAPAAVVSAWLFGSFFLALRLFRWR
jgi:ABC-type polysaccharide/polyol phosphate export permease